MGKLIPNYKPAPSAEAIMAQRNAKIEAQISLTQAGGADITVPSTNNPSANQNITDLAAKMSSMEKVNNAMDNKPVPKTSGGTLRRRRRTLRRRRRTFRRRRRR